MTTGTLTLAEFLERMLAEDEELATPGEHWDVSGWDLDVPVQFWDYGEVHIGHKRFLADVAAKRAIVARITDGCPHPPRVGGWCVEHCDRLLRALAQPYAGREGWREEWAL